MTWLKKKEQVEAEALESARRRALKRVKEGHAEALKEARERYSDTEREGWHELIADAKEGEGDCLREYAESLGINESDAAERVLSARDSYRKAYGKATGKLTRLRDAVDKVETVEELDAIGWSE